MSRLYDPGIQPFTVTLDTVTNTSGSYIHTTQNSSITASMKPIQIECSNPDAFGDNITITTSAGEITLTCNEVAGTSDVTVTLMQQVAEAFRPLEVTSTEFNILNNQIVALQNEVGIVVNGNTATQNVAKGQYVIVKNSTIADITDGLYTAAVAVSAGIAFTATDLVIINSGGLNALNNQINELKNYGYINFTPATLSRISTWSTHKIEVCGCFASLCMNFTVKSSSTQSSGYETIATVDLSNYIYDGEVSTGTSAITNVAGSISGTVGGNTFVISIDPDSTDNKKYVIKVFQYATAAKDNIVRCQMTFPFKKKDNS